jgi:hypothetical protein
MMATNFEQQSGRQIRPAAIVGGLIVLALGTLMLLDRTGAIDVRLGRVIGPIVLIILGATMIFEKGGVYYSEQVRDEDGQPRRRLRRRGSSTSGIWLIGLGVWMMVSQLHLWGLTFHNSWPLLIILMGILMVFRGWR